MKGVIVMCLKEMIETNYGSDKWIEVLVNSNVDTKTAFIAFADIDDAIVLKMLGSASKILKITSIQAADAFGDYWVNVYAQKMYRSMFVGKKTAKEFLLSMDQLHVGVTQNIKNAHPPRFEYELKGEKTLIIKYKSDRGLIDIFIGLIKGVGKLYKENLLVSKLGNNLVQVQFN
ncbi:MAG TPA: heme NO-binding domain-containing protein [Leptospiraceae bacterium]|nr:heme NO-binding domain-containing protein [Leptospiraceae bacterium]HMW04201.1 heme NO-binding domain-containing protein [Leptospiraceae bacterium]HMX32733.1 heme NO-binding domain-containing protein [Leptospiraceae bacterium]HMY30194.1 heme NO-binding domain-containing protein [Leptospiraceae bacterium]HMZ65177.1 heme NO-binding domain-containing protein [Leptospiraceae bacterium]